MTDKQKNKVSEIARLMGAPHPCDNGVSYDEPQCGRCNTSRAVVVYRAHVEPLECELLRLRAELEQYKDSIQSLRYVANKTLVDCNFRIKENISLKEEVLRIQAENVRLKEELENALHVNGLRLAEIAKTLFTGMVEGISGSGDSESVRVQTGATCVHCNACFTSAEDAIAHDKVCPKHPANIRAELLEKEAEWLANRLACIQSARDIEPQTRDQNPEWWREAARKAVEES